MLKLRQFQAQQKLLGRDSILEKSLVVRNPSMTPGQNDLMKYGLIWDSVGMSEVYRIRRVSWHVLVAVCNHW